MRPHLASLVEEFRAHAAETAVVEHRGNRRYPASYGALAELAGRFAAKLDRDGIAPGERVVLWGENSAEWIGVFFGCLLRGVMVVPLDAAGSAEFARRVIAETAPKLIVGDAARLAKVGGTGIDTLELAGIGARLPRDPAFAPHPAVNEQTPFQIVFTSGTTSEPRGIVHTHRNVLVTLEPIEREMKRYRRLERLVHPLRFLHSLPLSHVFGQFMGLWIPALLGAELHFSEQLEPARVTELIRRERISVLIAVPRVQQLLRAHLLARFPELAAALELPDKGQGVGAVLKKWWRFRRVHRALGWKFWAVISGGATLPQDLEAFWDKVGCALIQGYGMTETAALVTLNHPFHIAPGTIGRPLPGREVKLTGEGEILVRGDMLAAATWQHGGLHPREGEWLATGDLAERAATGELRFLGRKGDGIVTAAGLNIHPADLEAALAAQPGIRAAAVVPCELAAGPEPVAVVLTSLPQAQLDAAVATANRTLAEFQQMRRVLRWPEMVLPYTSTGKLLRRQVAAWACAQLTNHVSAALPQTDALLALLAELTGEPTPAAVDTNTLRLSEDLHLDSLGRVQLESELEQRFGVELDDDGLAGIATVGELRRKIQAPFASISTAPEEVRGSEVTVAQAAGSLPTPLPTTDLRPAPDLNVYPHWPWAWPVLALRIAFLECVARPLIWLLAAPRVRSELSPEAATPCLLIANHVTLVDGALVLYGLPFRMRCRVAAAMSGEMLLDYRHARNQGNAALNLLAPAAYWLLTALYNVFPLPQARGFRRSFAHAGEAMDRGYSVLIFPEGTRSRTGCTARFRAGIGLLAEESAVPIVPVALVGLYELARTPGSWRRWFHSGRIEIRVGAPLPAPAPGSDPSVLTATLEQALRALLEKPPRT